MSIVAETPGPGREPKDCTGCGGAKAAPLAAVVYVGSGRLNTPPTKIVLCQECGRDTVNTIGFMGLRDGWSKSWPKLLPRKKAAR